MEVEMKKSFTIVVSAWQVQTLITAINDEGISPPWNSSLIQFNMIHYNECFEARFN